MIPVDLQRARTLTAESLVAALAPDRAVLVARGPDRVAWLNGLVTADVSKARPGTTAFSFLCEKKGKIVCDLHMFFGEDEVVMVVPAACRDEVARSLEHHLIMEDVELASSARRVYRARGPGSSAALAALGGVVFSPTGAPAGLFLSRADGDDDAFGDALAGALRDLGGALVSPEVDEALRVEAGEPRFGVDYGPDHFPQETGLHTLGVSFSKGCYLGQEVLYMLEHRGRARQRVVRLTVAHGALASGARVMDEAGAEVGVVSSAVAVGGGAAGLAMLRSKAIDAGATLRAEGVECAWAEVVPAP